MRQPQIGKPARLATSAVVVRLLFCHLVGVLSILLTGCGGAVHHESFSQFSKSMHELRDGADKALEAPYNWGRERYVYETAAASVDTTGGFDAIDGAVLERDADNVFAWTAVNEPLYLRHMRFRKGVYQLNDGLVAYADLLSDVAKTDISASQFDERTEELNSALRGLVTAIGEPAPAEELALFSATGAELVRLYIENGKREHLRRALEENQKNIEDASVYLQEALHLTALHLWQEYDEKTALLIESLHPFAQTKPKDRIKRVRGIVEANEILVYQLNALEVLVESYRALPKANRELIDSLDSPEWSLNAISQIADNGLRLRRLYDELSSD